MEVVSLIASAINEALVLVRKLTDMLKESPTMELGEAQKQIKQVLDEIASDEARLRRIRESKKTL